MTYLGSHGGRVRRRAGPRRAGGRHGQGGGSSAERGRAEAALRPPVGPPRHRVAAAGEGQPCTRDQDSAGEEERPTDPRPRPLRSLGRLAHCTRGHARSDVRPRTGSGHADVSLLGSRTPVSSTSPGGPLQTPPTSCSSQSQPVRMHEAIHLPSVLRVLLSPHQPGIGGAGRLSHALHTSPPTGACAGGSPAARRQERLQNLNQHPGRCCPSCPTPPGQATAHLSPRGRGKAAQRVSPSSSLRAT